MAAGRRRRNSSSVHKSNQNSGSGGAQTQVDSKEEEKILSNQPEQNTVDDVENAPGPSAIAESLSNEPHNTPLPPGGDLEEDDPFAYDSDLETLSSVSSHLSISSSNISTLDQALELNSAADPEEQEGDDNQYNETSIPQTSPYEGGLDATEKNKDASDDAQSVASDIQAKSRSASKRSTPSSSLTSDNEEESDQQDTKHSAAFRSSKASSLQPNKRARYQYVTDETELSSQDQEDVDSNSQASDSGEDSHETNGDAARTSTSTTNTKIASPSSGHEKRKANADDVVVVIAASDADKEGSDNQDSTPPLAEDANDVADDTENNGDDGSQDEDTGVSEARRSTALAELTGIEIAFAQLRERLYAERLQQVQVEEEYLLAGRHTEYERHVSEITSAYKEQAERLKFEHQEWLKQRQHLHETQLRSTNYTFLVRRQELRSRMLSAQRKRMWRLRDMRVQEDRRSASKAMAASHLSTYLPLPIDEDVALIAQQTNSNIQQLRWARRAASNAQRCMVHGRKQRLAAPGLDPAEMDADYTAMNLPVYPREQKGGFRRVFVPPFLLEAEAARTAASANKKRKPRQPKKRRAADNDDMGGGASKGSNPSINGHNRVGKERTTAAASTASKGQNAGGRRPQSIELVSKPEMAATATKQGATPRTGPAGGLHQQQKSRVSGAARQLLAPLQQQQQQQTAVNAQRGSPNSSAALPRSFVAQPAAMPTAHPLSNPAMNENSGSAAATISAAAATGETKPSNGGKGRGSVDMRVPAGSSNPLGLKV
ncbi:hypothetical protein LPJ72_000774 [Coemansia sp. Benny D160-2]|nr:hypothetical protein LPJ72_000774 [Coemansia sp. Benny D160-2]